MKRLAPAGIVALFAIGALLQTTPATAGHPVPYATCNGYSYCPHQGLHRGRALARQAHPYGPTRMDRVAYNHASGYNWHGEYKYTQWGVPVALVVPPNAEWHAEMGWGVSETRVYRLNHQFQREYPGEAYAVPGAPRFKPTPIHPSDTTQFGVYPVRGPWD